MLPGATDAGLFFKPAQMLSIGKSTKNPQAAAKVINFLLNSKEGVDILGLERGVPLSKAAVTYLTEDGVIKADDPAVSGLKLAQSCPPLCRSPLLRRSADRRPVRHHPAVHRLR